MLNAGKMALPKLLRHSKALHELPKDVVLAFGVFVHMLQVDDARARRLWFNLAGIAWIHVKWEIERGSKCQNLQQILKSQYGWALTLSSMHTSTVRKQMLITSQWHT